MSDDEGYHRHRVPRPKLTVPEPPARLVTRARLLDLLDRAHDSLVTLIAAPAGAGKTVLLADWVRSRGGDEVAWVSLDSDDNDDGRFWSAVLEALCTSSSVPADNPLRLLAVPRDPYADQGFLADLVDALDDLPAPALLVLDDVHEVTNPKPVWGLKFLLRHQPANLRLIVSTRHEAHLPLARLRLADELLEIGADHLRFSTGETRALLAAAGIELGPDQVRGLVEQTEGWAAGVRLAALALSGTGGAEQLPADFAATDRAVSDYLVDEVLSRLPEDMRAFLRAISICEQVSIELAARLSGRGDAGALLETIAERTSLVHRTDGPDNHYRVHALLRSYLLADLVRQAPDRAAHLHRTAADWFADHDRPAPALRHAGESGDAARTTDLLHRSAVALVLDGRHELVRTVLDGLGARAVVENSLLALVSALLHLEQGEPADAERDLTHAIAAWPAEPDAELVSLRWLVRVRLAQFAGDIDELTRATENLDAEPPLFAAPAMLLRGTALLAVGDRPGARRLLATAFQTARDQGHGYVAVQSLCMLAWLAGAEGDFSLMVTLATTADDENTRRGWQRTAEAAQASLLLGYGAFLRADPAGCLHHVERAARLAGDGDSPAMLGLRLSVETLRGAAEFELGDRTAGAQRITAIRVAAGEARFTAEQYALCAVLEHRAALLLGRARTAADALRWAQAAIPDSAEVHLLRARAQLSLGRREAAGKIIQPVLDGSAPTILPWSVIEAWLLDCEIALSLGGDSRANRAIRHALSVAQRLDVPYPIVFAPAAVTALMTSQLGKLGRATESFVQQVFALRRALRVAPSTPLTSRERAVLRLLPTLRSFDEIAEDLTISANTVKTHVRAIYAKLGVTRRRDAVAVAVERGLLENETAANL
jgi:LuxR family maltose regulon positive regulatory protein